MPTDFAVFICNLMFWVQNACSMSKEYSLHLGAQNIDFSDIEHELACKMCRQVRDVVQLHQNLMIIAYTGQA